VAAVQGQPGVDAGTALMVMRTAVAQETKPPTDQIGNLRRAQQQRRVFTADPAHQLTYGIRCVPGFGMAGVQHAAVSMAAFRSQFSGALDQRHLMSGFGQEVGSGGAEHTAANDKYAHPFPRLMCNLSRLSVLSRKNQEQPCVSPVRSPAVGG